MPKHTAAKTKPEPVADDEDVYEFEPEEDVPPEEKETLTDSEVEEPANGSTEEIEETEETNEVSLPSQIEAPPVRKPKIRITRQMLLKKIPTRVIIEKHKQNLSRQSSRRPSIASTVASSTKTPKSKPQSSKPRSGPVQPPSHTPSQPPSYPPSYPSSHAYPRHRTYGPDGCICSCHSHGTCAYPCTACHHPTRVNILPVYTPPVYTPCTTVQYDSLGYPVYQNSLCPVNAPCGPCGPCGAVVGPVISPLLRNPYLYPPPPTIINNPPISTTTCTNNGPNTRTCVTRTVGTPVSSLCPAYERPYF